MISFQENYREYRKGQGTLDYSFHIVVHEIEGLHFAAISTVVFMDRANTVRD